MFNLKIKTEIKNNGITLVEGLHKNNQDGLDWSAKYCLDSGIVHDEITQMDITTQLQDQEKQNERLSLIQKGQQVLAFVIALNEKKYAAAELTLSQLVEMESYEPILVIERQLMRGTLTTARYSLQNYVGRYYNQADINSIIAKIESILG